MSREIKCRAWDRELKTFLFFNVTNSGLEIRKNQEHILSQDKNRDNLDQYTGLKDNNRVEIYEGDIVRYRPYDNLGYQHSFFINLVKWGETGDSDNYSHSKHYEWTVGPDSLADVADGNYLGFYCEVIGNIYENPELLEEDK